MSAPTLPVDLQWVAHTLTPYLRFAFQHVLRRNLDITPYVKRALDLCRSKPDSSTDGDDLVFERVFFAIERRHQGLPAELNGVTENLELLAQFLIRRAQVKGPYELLGRDVQPSGAWKKYESERLMRTADENAEAMQNQRQPAVLSYSVLAAAHQPAPPAFGMPKRPSPLIHLIDPRLIHALPGHFAAPGLSGTLTLPELKYYQYRNKEIEAYIAMKQAQLLNEQQGYGRQHLVIGSQGILQGHQQDPIHTPAQPTQHLLTRPGYSYRPPTHYVQQRPVPIASRPMPAQPVSSSTRRNNTSSGLPTLTEPAGISKSTSKAPMIASLSVLSDPVQCAKSIAAFKKLSREEKMAKILELDRAEKAMNPNAITRVQKYLMRQAATGGAAAGGEDRIEQSKGNAGNLLKSPDQQAITIPAPRYSTRHNAHKATPGVGGFAPHPGYSNVTSSFLPPQSHGPSMAPTLAPKQEKK